VRPSADHIPRVSHPHSPSHSHILRLDRQTTTHLPHDKNDPFDPTHSSSYFKMRSSSRPAHRHPSHSHRTPSRPRPRPRFAFLRVPSAMSRFSTFNIIRASIYCTFLLHLPIVVIVDQHFAMIAFVFLWSIICLALAAHFQSVLSASDLSESCTRDSAWRPSTDPSR